MKTKFKIKKRFKVTDLKSNDLNLLHQAYALPEEFSLCFGKSYGVLRALDLITDECKISWYGRKLVRSLS